MFETEKTEIQMIKEFPRSFPTIASESDLNRLAIETRKILRKMPDGDRLSLGLHLFSLGYLIEYLGGAEKLQGIKIFDVGGGTIDNPVYGPTMSIILSHLGADVRLIDPLARKGMLPEHPQIKIFPETVHEYLKKYEERGGIAVSNALLGYPTHDVSALIDEISQLSDIQIHALHPSELLDKIPAEDKHHFVYNLNLTKESVAERKPHLPNMDFVVIDDRKV